MQEAPLAFNERERLEELYSYEVLDTQAEHDIDDLTLLAAYICKAPIALVSLVDASRQWFKAKVGIDVTETPRALAFCAHTILGKDVLIVPDALADDRFADNPLVAGEPGIRFYAGAPLVTSKGYQLGTLCVIDQKPRTLLPEEKDALQILSQQVVHRLEQRRQLKELRHETAGRQQAERAEAASRRQLQNFVDTSHELIHRVAPNGRLLYTNRAWQKTLGYPPDEATGLSLFEIIHPDSLDHWRTLFLRLMAGESIPRMEVSFVAKDGRRIDVVGSATIETSDDGHPIATSSIFHDVTERKATEEQLRRSEAFLHSVLEHLPNMVFVKDAKNLQFIRVNQASEDLLGYSRDALIGKTDYDLFPKPQADFFVAKDQEVLTHRRLLDIPCETIHTKDRGDRFLHTKKIPLYNASGEPEYLLGISDDITDRIRAEEQLTASEKRLRTILETEPECVKIVTEDCVLLDMNPTGLALVEADSLEQIQGQSILPIVAPHDRERFAEFHRCVFHGEAGTMQFEIIGLKGTRRWMDTSAVPLKNDSGDTTGVLAITRDHTKQKQAEDALRNMNAELEERVRARTAELEGAYQQVNFHLQNTPLGVIQWAPDFKLLQWSTQAERIFGWTASEVEGTYPREWPFVHEDDRPAMQESMERLRSGRERRKVHRVRHCGKNGQDVHCVWHTSVMADESGRVLSMMALVQDLSGQVRLERQFHQAQKMEAVGRLASGVAHDFNNLLMVINGYSDVMLTDAKTPDAIKKVFEQILGAGNRATGLTRQLLAFSRQQVVQPTTLSLNATVTEAEKMLKRLIGAEVQLTLGLNADPDIIKADPVQVEQIIMNLAINARDAMPDGGRLWIGTVTVSLEEPLPTQTGEPLSPGTYVSLVVRDTGSGIEEATVTKIFEPFFTTKEPDKGTGLGLATVHGIVQQSGGAITVSSRVGEGTTFTTYFPSVVDSKIAANVPLPDSVARGGTETILLVEDEPTVRTFVHKALSSSGYTVLEVGTAQEAMALSKGYEHPIHLVVTDVVLPQGRGTKLAEELRRKRTDTKILLMSGHVDQNRLDDTALIRQLPFLQKPFTREVLLTKVREVLDVQRTA